MTLKTLSLALAFALSAQAKPLPLAAAIDALQPGWRIPLAVRPGGQQVAYCLMQPSRKQPMLAVDAYRSKTGVFAETVGNDIWLADATNQKVRNLTQGHGSSFAPTWSPDGRRLAFVSDRDGATHLWVWESGKIRRVSPEIVWLGVGFECPVWTPDSRCLIVKLLPPGLSIAQAAALERPDQRPKTQSDQQLPVRVYDSLAETARSGAAQKAGPGTADLCQIELSGKVRRLVPHAFTAAWWVSPNGKFLAYAAYTGNTSTTSQIGSYDLHLVNLGDGSRRTLAHFPSDFGAGVSWSPDSRHLAYHTMKKINDYEETDVFCLDLQGSSKLLITGKYFQESQGPAWLDAHTLLLRNPEQLIRCDLDGTITSLAALATRALVRSNQGVYVDNGNVYASTPSGLARIPLDGGEVDAIPGPRCQQATGVAPGPIFSYRQDPRFGYELELTRQHKTSPIHRFNQQFSDDSSGRPQLLQYGKSGAAMLLPPDYVPGKRYPMVLTIYGGRMGSRFLRVFGLEGSGCDNLHILASRGYIVLNPDLPIDKNPVADIVAGVDAAVDAAIAQGYADPERLAVMGHSYGGYSTLAVISHSTRFRAAIDRAGTANLIHEYLRFDEGHSSFLSMTETGQGNMHATLWENPTRYLENSPVFALDKVQTPLLIVHGDKDNQAWVDESGEVFVGLRRLGKQVTYLSYPGEGHWEGTWTRPHVLDYWQRSLAFLKQCGVEGPPI